MNHPPWTLCNISVQESLEEFGRVHSSSTFLLIKKEGWRVAHPEWLDHPQRTVILQSFDLQRLTVPLWKDLCSTFKKVSAQETGYHFKDRAIKKSIAVHKDSVLWAWICPMCFIFIKPNQFSLNAFFRDWLQITLCTFSFCWPASTRTQCSIFHTNVTAICQK